MDYGLAGPPVEVEAAPLHEWQRPSLVRACWVSFVARFLGRSGYYLFHLAC